jgi:8-oxo-dGTP pyrophosphatase MutT (NUDIX family)
MTFARLLQRVRACHSLDAAAFVPWSVAGRPVGRVHREREPRLLAASSPFRRVDGRLELVDGHDFTTRSAAIAAWARGGVANGWFRPPLGEWYPVPAVPRRSVGVAAGVAPDEALLQVDRSLVTWLGVRARGVHLNGWRRTATGPQLWLARRARGKRTFPGHLDNLVAGGQSLGFDAMTTLVKECAEEAGMSAALAGRAVATGELAYAWQEGLECKDDVLACFDLELPASFTPVPVDGEVESFLLWSVPQVLVSLAGDDAWKPNCALVALDFLLRHDLLDGALAVAERTELRRTIDGGV